MQWPWRIGKARSVESTTDALRAIKEAEAAKARASHLDKSIDENLATLHREVEKNHFAAALGFRPREV